jgi:hypothetical protein
MYKCFHSIWSELTGPIEQGLKGMYWIHWYTKGGTSELHAHFVMVFVACNFYFLNRLSPFLAWAKDVATPPKKKRKEFLLPSSPKRKINWTLHYCMLSLSLAACNFCFQNCLPPFLVRANTLIKNWSTYWMVGVAMNQQKIPIEIFPN